MFEMYWNLGSYNQRILHIGSLIDINDKKMHTIVKSQTNPRNRMHSMVYNALIDGKKITVCAKCFRKCYDETESFIKSVIKKKLNSPNIQFSDLRSI